MLLIFVYIHLLCVLNLILLKLYVFSTFPFSLFGDLDEIGSWDGAEVFWEEVVDLVVVVKSVVSAEWLELAGLLLWEVSITSHLSGKLNILSWDGSEVIWEKVSNGVVSVILSLIFAAISSEGLAVVVNDSVAHVVLSLVVLVISGVTVGDLIGVLVDESSVAWSVVMLVMVLHSDD